MAWAPNQLGGESGYVVVARARPSSEGGRGAVVAWVPVQLGGENGPGLARGDMIGMRPDSKSRGGVDGP